VTWVDRAGVEGRSRVRTLSPTERASLFVEGRGGPEPLWLWLGEDGMPLAHESWEKVFDAANERCARFGKPITCTPHMCRHSFALKMLVTLQRALDRRFGLSQEERRHVRDVYGGAFAMVKDLLGHASEQTTRDIYLEPVSGLRLRQILDSSEDLDTVLAQVASSSRRVMDVAPDGDER
jgi:integrase